MKKRITGILLAAALSFSLFTGCSAGSDGKDSENTDLAQTEQSADENREEADKTEKELTEVTLNEVAHSIFYAPMYVAIEEGYFEDEGIALDLVCGFGDRFIGIKWTL
ncbi:MAG TPA: hypothetical protein H9955_02060 [Candidatus Mediterraneibacter cottocaccae]|nr:hypothetical protein [Candidatus Mediterraneibacter cottocaccae]